MDKFIAFEDLETQEKTHRPRPRTFDIPGLPKPVVALMQTLFPCDSPYQIRCKVISFTLWTVGLLSLLATVAILLVRLSAAHTHR